MNRSKGAALLILVGAFAVGVASHYTFTVVTKKPAEDPCPPRGNESTYRNRVYEDLQMTQDQRAKWDSLIDARNKSVNEFYAAPRGKADSIRKEVREKQLALLTPEQRTKLQEREAAMNQQRLERQKKCETQQAGKNNGKSTSSK